MFHPTRGGTRGGQGLFKWEDVKEDKHRENYLGHSLLAPVGRWQKHKDLTWYTKDAEESQADIDNELAEIKKREAEALAEALGGPKRRDSQLKSTVSKQELQSVIKKDAAESLEAAPQEEADVANMKGLGFKRIGTAFAPPPPTVGAVKTEEDGEELPNNMTLLNGQASSEKRKVASADVTDQEDRKARKAKKKENKREKKEKKDKKKKKKREKRDGTDSEDEEKPVKRQRQEPGGSDRDEMRRRDDGRHGRRRGSPDSDDAYARDRRRHDSRGRSSEDRSRDGDFERRKNRRRDGDELSNEGRRRDEARDYEGGRRDRGGGGYGGDRWRR